MKKRVFVLSCIVAMFCSLFAVPAGAVNNVDVDFQIAIQENKYNSTVYGSRIKNDTSASFVNYKTLKDNVTNASGPSVIDVQIWGSYDARTGFNDCTSKTYSGQPRTPAYVARGTMGLIRQDVAEIYGINSWGKIYAKKCFSSSTGTAKGCWSVDSIGSYNYYNDVK